MRVTATNPSLYERTHHTVMALSPFTPHTTLATRYTQITIYASTATPRQQPIDTTTPTLKEHGTAQPTGDRCQGIYPPRSNCRKGHRQGAPTSTDRTTQAPRRVLYCLRANCTTLLPTSEEYSESANLPGRSARWSQRKGPTAVEPKERSNDDPWATRAYIIASKRGLT